MEKSKKCFLYMQILLIFCWLSFLTDSDSYFTPYLIIGMAGSICVYNNWHNKIQFCRSKENVAAVNLAAIFAVAVLMANYTMFADTKFTDGWGKTIRLIYIVVLILGGMVPMYHILRYLSKSSRILTCSFKRYELRTSLIFACSLAIISAVNMTFLFLAGYPGNLSTDSIDQISQIFSSNYSNHHPFYHTMVIKLFIFMGLHLFGDINAAVALYSVFQILFMAACFSFVILTLYQIGGDNKSVIAVLLWYTIMPFHIMYSFTMWKDVMFGGMVALFLTAIFRIQKSIGYTYVNWGLMIVGGIGVCLFRSNGLFAFTLSVICFAILFRKKQRKIFSILVGILVTAFILKHTALGIFEINQPDTIEALSIPAQQIARVIADDGDVTNNQLFMLEQVVDVGQIKEKYNQGISDPIKYLVRLKGNQKYLAENMTEYLKLYINIGIANPEEYIKAWIDETKGYWNGGYSSYWIWDDGVYENELGITQSVRVNFVRKTFDNYLWLFFNIKPLQILICIGFYVWGCVILGYVCLVRENKEGFFCVFLNLAIIFSLLISTPVFSEFRYAYAVFCCMPLLLFTSFHVELLPNRQARAVSVSSLNESMRI